MGNYSLIGFDMDGTLLNDEKQISERTLDAIHRAVSAGKTVALSTGRGIAELNDYKGVLQDVHYYVCESGALIYDAFADKILHQELFPEEVIHQIIDIVSQEDVMIYIMSNGRTYADRKKVADLGHYHMAQYQDLMESIVTRVDDIVSFYCQNSLPVTKLDLFAASVGIRERLREQMTILPVEAACVEVTSLELSPEGVHKGSGLLWLCEYLGIDQSQTIMVGDSPNDLEGLKVAGLSIAVANAQESVRDLCDAIVADNNHDGCAEAIDRYLLQP